MDEVNVGITQQNTLPQEQSSWYRASTLAERVAALKARRTTVSFPQGDQARKRLQRWQEQFVFKEGLAFLERLGLDGITEEDLLILLEPSVVIPLLTSADWTTELVQAFAAPPTPQDEALLPEPGEEKRSMSSFLKPVEPLLRRARARLHSGIERLESRYTICPFHTPAVLSSLFVSLSVQFRNLLTRTLVLEMHMYRVQQRLQGETPEQRFASFVDLLCQGQISTLLEEYPVLARQLVTTVEHWVAYGLEFLDHLCADWADLHARFSPETDPGPLMSIHVGAGDAHREGRTVLLLQFRNGLQLVYKPKSLATDVHFQELLTWLNACGYSPPLATMKIVDRGSYGWTEYVAPHDCSSESEVQRFYQRQGAYLALLYALQALDFHAENVIAAGEHPLLIDLEALFHPNDIVPQRAEHPAASVLHHSVLRVGLLPYRIHASDTDEGIDISGLGGWGKQLSPLPISVWEERGTDRMHLTRKQMELKAHQNLPRLNGQDIALLDYKEALLTGFTTMYRLLMKQRETFVTDYLPRFLDDETRVILRPTYLYMLLLRGSLHPNNVRDGLDRDRYLDRLFFDCQKWPYPARIVAAERAALLGGDIPLFTTRANSRDLWTCLGERLPDFFQQSGALSVQTLVQQLSEEDLQRQCWFIEASLTSLFVDAHRARRQPRKLPSTFIPATRDRLLAQASQIGRRLNQLAFWDEKGMGAGWLTVAHIHKHEWSVQLAGSDLYDGASGIIFFLAYLGKVTGEEHSTMLAKAALKTLQETLDESKQKRGPGAFQGLSSLIYLFCHLGSLWDEPALLDACEELIALLPPLIAKDTTFDIISGAAGCILALLAVHRVTSSQPALAAAIQCGEHLCQHSCTMKVGRGWKAPHQETPLAGFSHGCAGIAYSLLALFALTGIEHFKQTALDALAYERTLYVPEVRNWLDLREGDEERKPADGERQTFMLAWCHGAPGIGLARLASLPYLDDAIIREEIITACQTTAGSGFGINHSLCHGDMGNLETLLVAARTLGVPELHERVYRLAGALLDEQKTQDWVAGVPIAVETPGLMTGLAGIGYELLRLADPDTVPSVLLLEAPVKRLCPDKERHLE